MKRDFLRLLKELEADELRAELKMLYERFPVVQEYYALELGKSTTRIVDKYKQQMHRAFFSSKRRLPKRARSESNKILKAFAEVSIHTRDLLDLQLYRVEVMLEAIDYFYVDSEAFHQSTATNFEKALRLAKNEVLLDRIQANAEALVKKHEEVVRWPDDRFKYLLHQYFPEHAPDPNKRS